MNILKAVDTADSVLITTNLVQNIAFKSVKRDEINLQN